MDGALIPAPDGTAVDLLDRLATRRAALSRSAAVDLCIPADVPEDTFAYAPTTTRLAQLAVLDLLATGVALGRRPARAAHLERVKETMSDQWLVAGDPRAGGRRRTRRIREAKP